MHRPGWVGLVGLTQPRRCLCRVTVVVRSPHHRRGSRTIRQQPRRIGGSVDPGECRTEGGRERVHLSTLPLGEVNVNHVILLVEDGDESAPRQAVTTVDERAFLLGLVALRC